MSEPRAEYKIEIHPERRAKPVVEGPTLSPEVRYIVEGPLPPDLNLAIMTVLSFHISRQNPISRSRLCSSLSEFKISDRHIRDRIKHLRRSGHLIGSIAGQNGGYYLITTADELQEFLTREYLAKINDMQQTVKAMTKTASQRWGPDSIQLKLL